MTSALSIYARCLAEARTRLRQYAVEGKQEACVLLDQVTGDAIDFHVGDVDEVTPDWSKVTAAHRVTALHSHRDVMGPGPEDWDALSCQVEVVRLEVVDPAFLYVVEKPSNWRFQAVTKPGRSILGSVFQRVLRQVCREPLFSEQHYGTEVAAQEAQIWETNLRFARESHVAAGFQVWREVL